MKKEKENSFKRGKGKKIKKRRSRNITVSQSQKSTFGPKFWVSPIPKWIFLRFYVSGGKIEDSGRKSRLAGLIGEKVG